MKKAKKLRWYFTAGGVLAGMVVAFPIGKFIGKSAKAIAIAIPVGAVLGGGAGFLLGDLLHMPDYYYEPGSVTDDLQLIYDELDDMNQRFFLEGEK